MKYIKSFADQAALNNYYDTAKSRQNYLLRNESGTDDIGNYNSGKKIQSFYKPTQPLTFTAQEPGSTVKYNAIASTTGEYSYDNINWQNAAGVTITLSNVGDKVYYRGTITGNLSYSNYATFTMTGKIAASGSVMSMYNKNADDTVISYNYTFYGLFSFCSSLTTAPELTATTLADNCYSAMFYNCSGLTTAPELPAITLANGCYASMFLNCTGLTTAPELPATTLATACYTSMFNGCSSLTTAPDNLPATTLAEDCYDNMFYVCTSLTTAPKLPATTLADSCYYYMFSGCSSLTTAPELPATTLADWCYCGMFDSCSSLTAAPELPATTLATGCYDSMFYNCSSLNYVKHYVISWNIEYTEDWLYGVAADGIVECPTVSTIPSDLTAGIPTGWTRQNF